MKSINYSDAADLHLAYQYGEDVAKGEMVARTEFEQRFAGNSAAAAEFQRGVSEQLVRQRQASTAVH